MESKENLTDLDTTAPTSEQSYNEYETSTPNNDDVFKLPSLLHQNKTELPLMQQSDVPILPSLAPQGNIHVPSEGNKVNEENDGIVNAGNLLASFFGISNWCCNGAKEKTKESILSAPHPDPLLEKGVYSSFHDDFARKPVVQPLLRPEPSRSLPISILRDSNESTQSLSNDRMDGNGHGRLPLHETFGVPFHTPSYADGPDGGKKVNDDDQDDTNSQPPPQSYVDPGDGHIWRSKFCVLVDGVLFFYQNAKIGNSRDAELERNRMSSHPKYEPGTVVDEVDYLGKSPMPRNLHPMLSAKEKNGGGSFCHDPTVYWEKRVALNMVGAVRSSPDFGECAFELIAIGAGDDSDGEEDLDRLVLRASAADEVNSWIFEIHKSFVLLMKELAAVVGSSDSRSSRYVSHNGNIFGSNALYSPPPPAMNRGRSISARSDLIAPNSPMIGPILGGPARNSTETLVSTLLQVKGSRSSRRRSFGFNTDFDLNSITPPGVSSPLRLLRSSSDEFIDTMTIRPSLSKSPGLKISSSRSSTRLSEEASLSIEKSNSFEPLTQTMSEEMGKPKIVPIAKKYVPPHLRQGASAKKYIPPHLRRKIETEDSQKMAQQINGENNIDSDVGLDTSIDLRDQIKSENAEFEYLQHTAPAKEKAYSSASSDESDEEEPDNKFIKLGGCADPFLVKESICHESYIPHGASKVTLDHDAYGYINEMSEIGAVSRIGIRDYNEDAFLILNDLLKIQPTDDLEPFNPSESYFYQFEQRGLFAIFDGHCGNQAARYAAEKFQSILLEESLNFEVDSGTNDYQGVLRQILFEAVTRLDDEFCEFCSQGGREWYAGSTAIIAVVLDDHIAVASVGDASGVFSASTGNVDRALMNEWTVLAQEENGLDDELNKIGGSTKGIIYKEVNDSHCPNRPEEKERIHAANGWITHETDIPIITQFQRMDWGDRDVLDIFLRCFSDRLNTPARILNVYRVCGDLAVSRAIGDKEYKAAFNQDPNGSLGDNEWRSPAPMPYNTYSDIHNEEHTGLFEGDLVISTPDIRFFELGAHGTDEFLLIACDGLWDVIDPDDAVRVTRNLLFGVEISARECAERLAQIAKGLGSSDNITVIVVRFYGK
jgi:serine/threonine protein phosphatase PrpC